MTFIYADAHCESGTILFDGCTFNIDNNCTFYDAYNTSEEIVDLNITFKNTLIPDNMDMTFVTNRAGINLQQI